MDTTTAAEATPELQVVFRGKKRKTYRQRAEPDEINNNGEESKVATGPQPQDTTTLALDAPDRKAPVAAAPANQSENTSKEEEEGLSVAEALRLRNARKSRLGGVKFGGGSSSASGDATTAAAAAEGSEVLDDLSLMIREEESKAMDMSAATAGVKNRFAPQTGLATELVNKHMEEYIEAELSRRHNAIASSPSSSSRPGGPPSSSGGSGRPGAQEIAMTTSTTVPRPQQRSRALQGQLLEIDLGDEARSRNEALTARATRRLQGEDVEDEEAQGRPKKVRLGKDGKPWRSRNRRGSDDIKRDQMVEEILRENRLDVYETPTPPPAAGASGVAADGTGDEEGAADDRIAEEFRREFMDAMAQRHQRRKKSAAPSGSKAAAKKDDEVLRGPKLGGSRNVRAAMRNILLEKAKEAKKGK
ncbi:hypothetical protein AAE478_000728 [Parahypoxylon ruwenzoriense]